MDKIVIKKPVLSDIKSMQAIVKQEVINGNILDRSDDEVATNIRSYYCAFDKDELIGFGALHIHSDILAEIRSLVVKKEYRGKKIGQQLVDAMIKEAKKLGLNEVLVLTYKKDFFQYFGFKEIDKSLIPEPKIWADCIKCKHFPICDEIALIMKL